MSKFISKKYRFGQDWAILILALGVDLIVSLFIYKWDPLSLAKFINDQVIIIGIYAFIIYVLLILLGLWHNALIEKLRRKDYEKLEELCDLMGEGNDILHIVRRNYKNATEKELKIPIKKLDSWHINVYQKYKEIDPIKAETWKISEIETRKYTDEDYGETSAQYLNIMDSKINKLKRDLNRLKDLKDMQREK